METGTIDKLFLELSQYTNATTKTEVELKRALRAVVAFKNAYQQQGELEDRALNCVFDMHDVAQKALDAIDD